MTPEEMPARVETERLVPHRPAPTDVDDVFSRYASDPVALVDRLSVTRVHALCYASRAPSAHVPGQCGFALEGVQRS
jgi:hypothetical protein